MWTADTTPLSYRLSLSVLKEESLKRGATWQIQFCSLIFISPTQLSPAKKKEILFSSKATYHIKKYTERGKKMQILAMYFQTL